MSSSVDTHRIAAATKDAVIFMMRYDDGRGPEMAEVGCLTCVAAWMDVGDCA